MRADTLFTWEFRAASGDAWGGTLVAGEASFRPGDTRTAAAGTYTILTADPRGQDLSGLGLAFGAVFVEWYRDFGSQTFLPTRNGPGLASGTAGLGSEADAAWTGESWAIFGRGGLDQADAARNAGSPATVRFSWVFDALTGDRWSGELFGAQGDYAVGQVVTRDLGRYRIVDAVAIAPDGATPVGAVQLTGSYFESTTGAWLPVQQPGGLDGTDGLGTETGTALLGGAWLPFGQAGLQQVGAVADVRHFPFALSGSGFGIESRGSRIALQDGTVLTGFGRQLVFTDGRMSNQDGDALFDGIFYASAYRDIFAAQVQARAHYQAFGWREGRDPNAFFSTFGYLSQNGDVRSAGLTPLEHYRAFGWREGRDPSWNFDAQLYLVHNRDVAAAGLEPLGHYLAFGAAEGRVIMPAIGRSVSQGFDAEYYRLRNPDVGFSGIDPEAHYRLWGWREGRDPNAWFDTAGYLAAYPDVRAAGIEPLAHYMAMGWREGRDPSPRFDTSSYLDVYADVARAGLNPFDHFLRFGIFEGRSAQGDGVF